MQILWRIGKFFVFFVWVQSLLLWTLQIYTRIICSNITRNMRQIITFCHQWRTAYQYPISIVWFKFEYLIELSSYTIFYFIIYSIFGWMEIESRIHVWIASVCMIVFMHFKQQRWLNNGLNENCRAQSQTLHFKCEEMSKRMNHYSA